jgi:hypothetical protein
MDELIQLEDAGWRSLCEQTGSAFYGSLMTENALMILANGSVMTRDQVVKALAHAPAWDSYSIDDPATVPISDGAFALTYKGSGESGSLDFHGIMTSLYVRAGSDWKLALYQQTPIADG